MPRTRVAHFTEIEGQKQEEPTGEAKTRIKYKCELGRAPVVFRNAEQLVKHLASTEG
jgi:hypothetical protein